MRQRADIDPKVSAAAQGQIVQNIENQRRVVEQEAAARKREREAQHQAKVAAEKERERLLEESIRQKKEALETARNTRGIMKPGEVRRLEQELAALTQQSQQSVIPSMIAQFAASEEQKDRQLEATLTLLLNRNEAEAAKHAELQRRARETQ